MNKKTLHFKNLPLHVVLLGPQGSGKGTQAELLAKELGLTRIETGAIFRRTAASKTPIGRRLHRLITGGTLVPDKLVISILRAALQKVSRQSGIVFDGYPRTLKQARALDGLLAVEHRSLTHAIYIPISRRTTIKRLSLRRTCEKCGTPWILGRNISPRAVTCKKCGGRVYQREDDKPIAIAKRLREYLTKTLPIVDYYRRRGILYQVDGEPSIPDVWRTVKEIFT